MTRPALEVADLVRQYGPAYLEAFGDVTSAEQRRVLRDLERCRTAALGGHVEVCDQCGHERIAYNSCRNRHCPKCQGAARAKWLEDRAGELLPVEYFHVVFTLPDLLGPVGLHNPRVLYGTLFRAAAETLLQLARDPKHLGADIGFLAVLHTWGQNLHLHPHVHCVVAGGGISPDGTQWLACRPGFFLPVRVLSRLFRGKFLAYLEEAHRRDPLAFHGQQRARANPATFLDLLDALHAREFVVFAKPPFGGPECVLKYLARYTHRVAISNHRLLKIEEDRVYFSWKDYAHGNKQKVMALDAIEFLRRFLLHVLPSGFVRIRHYGYLANRQREEKLRLCRTLLGGHGPSSQLTAEAATPDTVADSKSTRVHACPVCKNGQMIIVAEMEPTQAKKRADEASCLLSTHDTS
jgi:Putative transposase/Transposase zinc-binding domain